MEIPTRRRDPPPGLPSMPPMPSIFVGDGSGPSPSRGMGFGASNRPGFSSFSPPVLIPNSSRNYEEPPPPLPPPRYVPIDGPVADHRPVFPEPNIRHDTSMSAGSGYFSSLNGSLNDSMKREMRWGRNDRDEGYGSMSSTRSQNSIPTRFGISHDKFQFRPSVDAYDSAQLQKLNSHRNLNNRSPPHRSSLSSSDSSSHIPASAAERQRLKPLSLPTRPKHTSLLDSPNRYTETPLRSAISPRSTPFGGLESLPGVGIGDFERSPISRYSRTTDGGRTADTPDDATVSTQGSYEMDVDDTDFPMEETSRLRIDDQARSEFQHATGLKRRASSPPLGDEPLGAPPSTNDMLRRREAGASRGSPTPRLSSIPQGSSMTSPAGGHSGSFASNLSLAASSLNSVNSFGPSGERRSPGGLSPSNGAGGGLSPTEPSSCGSPFGTPISLTASPRSSVSSRTPHNRTLSGQDRDRQQQQHQAPPPPPQLQQPLASPRKLSDLPKVNVSRISGFFMCECCPKKPKKFETQEALSHHEAEKQYECSFCGNRFKNKNEAERHQNSLHVRRHSWSCSALSSWSRAFHESTNQPGRMDTCGYCGREFSRSGPPARSSPPGSAGSGVWTATDHDWEERVRHLTDAHKFRECNSSKKFYRADHFRQHLKHSHAGTSGKWTNMLETACMLEEEPPMPMQSSPGVGTGTGMGMMSSR